MFAALGTWQVERRSLKLDLIAHVEQRLDAAAVVAPGRARWPKLDREQDAYRKLFVDGVFLDGHETLVQAVTAKGPGFWLMSPMRVADGSIVLVKRGFADPAHRVPATRRAAVGAAPVRVPGLTRTSAQGGG